MAKNFICEVRTADYLPFVKKMLEADADKYRNYNEIAAFILSSPKLSNEQKVLGLYNAALIFEGLAGLDNSFFTSGKAKNIIGFSSVLTDPAMFLARTADLFPNNRNIEVPKTLEELMSRINDFMENTEIVERSDIYDRLAEIHAFVKLADFSTNEARVKGAEAALNALVEGIEALSSLNQKNLLKKIAESYRPKLLEFSSYVSINEISGNDAANLDNAIVTLPDGRVTEAFADPKTGAFMYYDVVLDQNGEAVDGEFPVPEGSEIELANRSERGYHEMDESGNSYQHVFFGDTISSALKIVTRRGSEREAVDQTVTEALGKLTDPLNQVRITIKPVGNIASTRVDRIRSLSLMDSNKYGSLAKRNHETFETPAQENYLRTTVDGKILTLARPDSGFFIEGEILATGQKFRLYSTGNYAFVHSDNFTEAVDFSNPEHLQEVKRLSVNKDNKMAPLTDREIANMRQSNLAFKEFAERAEALMGQGGGETDITGLFFEHYGFGQKKQTEEFVDVDRHVEYDNLMHSVPVAVFDQNGKIVDGTNTNISIPLYFTKQKNSDVFTLKDTLPPGMKVVNPQGQPVELWKYAEEQLGLTQERLRSFYKSDQTRENATGVLIQKLPNEQFTVKKARTKNLFEDTSVFAQYVLELAMVASIEDSSARQKAIDVLELGRFNFKLYTPSTARNGTMTVSHSVNSKGTIRLKFKGWASGAGSSVYSGLIKDRENLFTIPLDILPILKTSMSLRLKGKVGTQLRAELDEAGVDLSQFDISPEKKFPEDPESLRNFFRWLQENVDSGKETPSAKLFLQEAEKSMFEMGEMLKNNVVGKLVANMEREAPEVLEQMKKDFTVNGVFMPELLLVDLLDNGMAVPKIAHHSKNRTGQNDYFSRLGNFQVLQKQQLGGKTMVLAKSVARPDTGRPSVNPEVRPVAPAPIPEQPTATQSVTDFEGAINLDEIPLELGGPEISLESSTERQSALEWLRENYPQFGIEEGDISELLGLAMIDGEVLGAFAEKVIYLNNMVLGKGTVYHEAFHAVFRHLMDPVERRKLLDTVIRDKRNSPRFTAASLKEFALVRNLNLSDEAIRDLIAEEILAEGFQSFMGEKSSPRSKKQGILARFFEMLKKIIKMVTQRRDIIREFYSKVGTGAFSQRTMQSDMFGGQTAFEVIPGIVKISELNGKPVFSQHKMDEGEKNNLIDMLVSEMLRDNPSLSFEERFERAAKKAREEIFNLERLIAKAEASQNGITPLQRKMAKQRLGLRYANYAFVLGGRESMDLPDYNMSDNTAYDSLKTAVNSDVNDEKADNTNGQQSKQILKKEVARRISRLNKMIEMDPEEDDADEDLSKVMSDLEEGKSAKKTPDGYDESNDEIEKGGDFEASMNEFDRMDALNRQLRMFLTNIRADMYDPETGLNIPRVVSAENLFSVLLKISANIEPRMIIPNILLAAEQMRDDGNLESAAELYAVHNAIDDLTALDQDGYPTRNEYLYNMLTDVLHGTEEALIMVSPYTKLGATEEEGTTTVRTVIKDKIISTDTWVRKRALVSGIVLAQGNARSQKGQAWEDYKNAARRLQETVKKVNEGVALSQTFTKTAETVLEELATSIKKDFEILGMDIPRSLIKLSLMAIDRNEKGNNRDFGTNNERFYQVNQGFVQERAYLEGDFWKDLGAVMQSATTSDQSVFKSYLDELNQDASKLGRFNAILGNAARYMVKYDPSALPSTVRNAEGKPVFRYTKYTSLRTMLEDIRRNGLEKSMEKDPYWSMYIRDFIADNAWLNASDENLNANMKLFLSKMDMALFGGVQQLINGKAQEGTGFKDLDEKSLQLSFISMFMDRRQYSDTVREFDSEGNLVKETNAEVEVFMRPYSQLEASQTNYLVSGFYRPYAGKIGTKGVDAFGNRIYLTDTGQYKLIVEDLENTVKQEFARMSREFERSQGLKDKFDSGEKNDLILGYNAVHDKLNRSVADVTDYDSLRAYKFHKLEDFFSANPEIGQELREAVFNKNTYEGLSSETKKSLREALDRYSEELFRNHLKTLVTHGAIKGFRNAAGRTYYTSEFLTDYIQYPASKKVSLESIYGNAVQGIPNYQSLLRDSFFNNWANGLMLNDIFDGDRAMSVKDGIAYFKRNKKWLAASSNMKEGYHKVAYTNTILGYVYEAHPEYGVFGSIREIISDPDIPKSDKLQMIKEFKEGTGMQKIFDGQSVSSIMHQMDMLESIGRLDQKSKGLLVAKHFRELTMDELAYLKSMNIVMNAKKTVTSARSSYHKQSEVHIDRNDVSVLAAPFREAKDVAYKRLQYLYEEVYVRRKEIARLESLGEHGEAKVLSDQIRGIVRDIHSFFEPLPHREKLHDLLNSMEYFQIDQMMDTEASKNATLLPMDLEATPRVVDGGISYLNLGLSSIDVENRFKYMQVETSGVKDTAKFSVQSKALLPADILNLEKLMLAKKGSLTEDERKGFENVKGILKNYETTLRDVAGAMSKKFKTFLRKDGDFDIPKLYDMIRESLELQGAPSNQVELFELDAAGQPKYSPNLPAIRFMLEYYFFSIYSKNVTDEKGAGFKNIHISSYGYYVIEDTITGQVVPTHVYKADPSKFPQVRTRSLKTSVEKGPDGRNTYFMEVIVPRPKFESPEHERFWMENLSKMFGTRIPTEDKRSMVAMKVVDFIDSSNASGIIVPHAVHMLSGSDFDVDALYGQTKAFFKGLDEKYRVYGDYKKDYGSRTEAVNRLRENIGELHKEKEHLSPRQKEDNKKYRESLEKRLAEELEQQSRYLEYISYFASEKTIKPFVKEAFDRIMQDPDLIENFSLGSVSRDILEMMGISAEEATEAVKYGSMKELLEEFGKHVGKEFETVKNHYKTLGEMIADKESEIASLRLSDKPDKNRIRILSAEISGLISDRKEMKPTLDAFYENRNNLEKARKAKTVLKVQAITEVLSKYGLPISYEAFVKNPALGDMVVSVYQNSNLDAKLDLISNELVFRNLYIDERSSTKDFDIVMDDFGVSVKEASGKANVYTVDGIIATKKTTSMNKDGIGITANLNKFLALASTLQLQLKKPIWSFMAKNSEGVAVKKTYDMFGGLNEKGKRTIAIIGNALGMFADGAKEPIPAALYMNEINASVSLAMIGVGLDPSFAIGFNFLPEVQKAVREVISSVSAIGDTIDPDSLRLEFEMKNQILELVKKSVPEGVDISKSAILEELSMAGLIKKDANPYYDLNINTELLSINFSPVKLNKKKLAEELLSPSEIGFEVSSVAQGAVPLTQDAQKLVLLELYRLQANQVNELRKAGGIVNLYKSLNPQFMSFDSMMSGIEQAITKGAIFTDESVDKIMDSSQIYPVLLEMMNDLDQQSKNIFMERSDFMSGIRRMFGTVISDPAQISKALAGFVGIRALLKNYPGKRTVQFKDGNKVILEFFAKDDAALIETFKPDYWITNTLGEELEKMKQRHPGNSFLNSVVEKKEVLSTYFNTATNLREQIAYKYLVLAGNSKKRNEPGIASDFLKLLKNEGLEERLFMKKLFYHELARTGLASAPGSVMRFMPPELQKDISDEIERFAAILKTPSDSVSRMMDAMNAGSEKELEDLFEDLFMQLVYKAIEDPKNKRIKTAKKLPLSNKNIKNILVNMQVGNAAKYTDHIDKVKEVYEHVFGPSFVPDPRINATLDISSTNRQLREQGLTINLKLPENKPEWMTGKTMEYVASQLGIKKVMTETNIPKFVFPLVIRIQGGFLKLKGTDISGTLETTGELLVKSLRENTSFAYEGYNASYEFISQNSVPKFLNSISFTREQVKRFAVIREAALKRDGTRINRPVDQTNAEIPQQAVEKPVEQVEDMSFDPETEDDSAMLGLLLDSPMSTDMQALNLTPDVLDAVYKESSMSLSREQFEKIALEIVASTRASLSPEQIIEQLKCL
jgi:hypothetical protein